MAHFFDDWLLYPGVRHLTAYFAGMSNLTIWRFVCMLTVVRLFGSVFYWTRLEVRREVAFR